jgi:long-chain acyl-CoA synthetase
MHREPGERPGLAMPRATLIEYLENFYRRGGEIAFAHRRGYRVLRWTYREVAETAAQFARELEARGVAKGERVMLWGGNSAEWVAAFLGCLLRGAVVVPMDAIASPDFVRRVGQQVNPRLLVRSRELLGADSSLPTLELETLRPALQRHARGPYAPPELARADPVEIVYTSGTTSEPKGVVISHANLLSNLVPIETEIPKYRKYERWVHPVRFLSLLPLSHVFGQFTGIFVPPLMGGTVIFQDSLNPSEVIHTLRSERVTVLATVPRLLHSLREKLQRDLEAADKLDGFRRRFARAEREHFLLRWWRFRDIHRRLGWRFLGLVSGGAALDAETEEFWRRLGYAVVQGYGMTETSSLITLNHPFHMGRASIGKPLPGHEVKLDASGEILVRGESVTRGYWPGRDLSAGGEPIVDGQGWFHTGDLGERDANGNLYFRGRRKGMMVTAEGMNLYPEDLEAALRRQPGVRECAVVGLERGGNAEPCAVLILAEGADPETVVRQANQSLAGYQQMRRWMLWPGEDFPRSSIQKPRARAIQEVVEAQLGARAAAPAAERKAGGSLAELIAGMTGRAPLALSSQADLEKDLQLSSVDRVELLSSIEDRFQVDLNETRFAAATTVGELEKMLLQPSAARSDYRYPRWAQCWPVTWLRLAAYYLLSWPATVLLGYPRVRGRENLRGARGPVLVVSNHVTLVDVGYVLFALPGRFRHRLAVAMLGELLQSMRRPPAEMGFLRRVVEKLSYALVVALFNVFPLPQQSGFRQSFAYAGESVDRGYSVLVFPEGERTPDGRLGPFRAGVGLLAERLNIPVVPVRIDGLFELKQAGKKVTRPGRIKVTIGAPVRYPPGTAAEEIARDLRERVQRLPDFQAPSAR